MERGCKSPANVLCSADMKLNVPFGFTLHSEYGKVSVKMFTTLRTEVMCLSAVYNCYSGTNLLLKIKLNIVLEAVVNFELEK